MRRLLSWFREAVAVGAAAFLNRLRATKMPGYTGQQVEPLWVNRANGRRECMQPLSACGVHLVCEPFGNSMRRELIYAGNCDDQDAFWRAWRQCGGSPDVWVGEDGEPVRIGP